MFTYELLEAELFRKQGRVFWITGLSGAGKTTLAARLYAKLQEHQQQACLLDGDIVRAGLCRDLGFTATDRTENIRRVAEMAKLIAASNITVLAALISPRAKDRALAREIIGTENFVEVFVDTPLGICMQRDPKGLYRKAAAGDIPHFTGVSDVYERPERADFVVLREEVLLTR